MSSKSSFSIREAMLDDLPQIQKLSYEAFVDPTASSDRFLDDRWSEDERGEIYYRSCIEKEDHILLVAISESKPVGYLAGNILGVNDWRPVKKTELLSFFVDSEFRSHGIGAALCQQFFNWSKSKGVGVAEVSAYASNDRAIAFYKRLGFQPYSLVLEIELDTINPKNT